MGKTAVFGVADPHINSTVALSKRSLSLDDGGTYKASRTQCALFASWLDFCAEARRVKAKRKIAVIGGDIGELDVARRSYQLITPNKATIMRHVIDVLEPLLAVVDNVIIIRGTRAHTGKSAWLEEAIANDIDTVIKAPKDGDSFWHFRGSIEGVKFDIAHHAPMGRLPWTEKYAASKIASIAMWRYMVEMKQPAPDVMWRAHNHRRSDSGHNYETFVSCLPCWSSATEYAHRIGQENSVSHIGYDMIICENGKYTWEPIEYKPIQERRVWSLKI